MAQKVLFLIESGLFSVPGNIVFGVSYLATWFMFSFSEYGVVIFLSINCQDTSGEQGD